MSRTDVACLTSFILWGGLFGCSPGDAKIGDPPFEHAPDATADHGAFSTQDQPEGGAGSIRGNAAGNSGHRNGGTDPIGEAAGQAGRGGNSGGGGNGGNSGGAGGGNGGNSEGAGGGNGGRGGHDENGGGRAGTDGKGGGSGAQAGDTGGNRDSGRDGGIDGSTGKPMLDYCIREGKVPYLMCSSSITTYSATDVDSECVLPLARPTTTPKQIDVLVDCIADPERKTMGTTWTYSEESSTRSYRIQFLGEVCSQIRQGLVSRIDIGFDCRYAGD